MAVFAKSRLQVDVNAEHEEKRLVMLIDDEDANLRAMEAILHNHYKIITAHNGEEALRMIKEFPCDMQLACIISDQRMPHLTGVEFFQQSCSLLPHTIRIIVTGFSDLDAIISSINKAEIFKFIFKPFDANDFLQTVQKAVELFDLKRQMQAYYRDLENKVKQRTEELEQKNIELERAQNDLAELALNDPLTQLRNRRFLTQRIDTDVSITLRRHEEWRKRACPGAMLDMDLVFFFADIDHFKQINAQYGQAAGDSILRQMRERLQEVFRESDYLVRWGGEEFLLVARATNRSDAGVVAERIRYAVNGRNFSISGEQSVNLSCSIGFASFPFVLENPRSLTWSQVADLAEQAMLLAKDDGRNAWFGIYATELTNANDVMQFVMRDCQTAAQVGQVQIVKSLAASSR